MSDYNNEWKHYHIFLPIEKANEYREEVAGL